MSGPSDGIWWIVTGSFNSIALPAEDNCLGLSFRNGVILYDTDAAIILHLGHCLLTSGARPVVYPWSSLRMAFVKGIVRAT